MHHFKCKLLHSTIKLTYTRQYALCKCQIHRQQKHLHQYWNSQNRDSLRVPDATGSTDERGQRPAPDNRSLSAINFATYSGPRNRDYSFGPNPKVAHWLMGNQYVRAEFSEVLWEERRLVRWWCQRLGEKHSSAEKWRCDKSVTEWEVWKSLDLFTHQCVNESMKKRVTRKKENHKWDLYNISIVYSRK